MTGSWPPCPDCKPGTLTPMHPRWPAFHDRVVQALAPADVFDAMLLAEAREAARLGLSQLVALRLWREPEATPPVVLEARCAMWESIATACAAGAWPHRADATLGVLVGMGLDVKASLAFASTWGITCDCGFAMGLAEPVLALMARPDAYDSEDGDP